MRSRVADDASLGAKFEDQNIPEDLREQAEQAREQMLEAIAEVDDDFLQTFVAANDNASIEVSEISPSTGLANRIRPRP